MAKFETLQDDFNDNSFDTTKWTDLGGGGSLSESSQQLTLNSGASSTSEDIINKSGTTYDLTSSYVQLQLKSTSTNASFVFQLIIADSGFTKEIYWQTAGTLLQAANFDGVTNTILASTTYNSAVHKWIRIREAGGTAFFDYSTDGISWTNFTSTTPPMTLTAVVVDIGLTTTGPVGVQSAVIDNFNIIITTTSTSSSTSTSTSISTSSTSSSISTSSTSSSISTSTSLSTSSTSSSTSKSTSTSSTSSSTSISTSSTSSSISTSSTSQSTSTSVSTSTSTTVSLTTSTSSTSSSISTSSTSSSTSISTSTSLSTSSTSSSTSTTISTSSTSSSTSLSTSSTSSSTSLSTSTSSTSQSTTTVLFTTSTSSTSSSSTSSSTSTTTTVISIDKPLGQIRHQGQITLPITGDSTLVDSTTLLVDDTTAFSGGQSVSVETIKVRIGPSVYRNSIKKSR